MPHANWWFLLFALLWLWLANSQPPATREFLSPSVEIPSNVEKPQQPVVAPHPEPPRPRYVFLIVMDGLRPDALQQANTPNINSLWQNGSYTWRAQTTPRSLSLPAIVSLLTGLTVEHHGVDWNDWEPDRGSVQSQTLLDIAHAAGLTTAIFAGKKKLEHLYRPAIIDHFEVAGSEAHEILQRATAYIDEHKPQLVFIQLPEVEAIGQRTHWMSPQQLRAIEQVDAELGSFLQFLASVGIKDQSLILLTSSHGGHGKISGSTDPRDLMIPWILWGVGVQKNHEIAQPVQIWDSAPTILHTLGLSASTPMDGKPVLEVFQSVSP